MKNSDRVTYLIKIISLLILDIITFLLFFSVWALSNISLFPWALISTIFSLIMVNIAVLATKEGIIVFGREVYTSVLISTVFYYVFVMVFTGMTYIAISPKWYVIIILIATLIYIAIVSGLRISGIIKNKDMEKQELEHTKVLDINLQLMNIEENIKKAYDFVEKVSYNEIIEAFNDMNERLKLSTPFGRVTKPAVLNLENQIILKLCAINDDIALLKTTNDNKKSYIVITEVFTNIKVLIMNREKLIIQ